MVETLTSVLKNSAHIVNNSDSKTLFVIDTVLSSDEIYTQTNEQIVNNTSQLNSKNPKVSVYYEVKFYDTNGYKKQLYSWTGNHSTKKEYGSIEIKRIGKVANNKMSSYSIYIKRTDKQKN